MKYDIELEQEINKYVDKKYASFHSGLVPGCEIRGVKIPVLRNIAKQFSVYPDFLENVTLDNYESISVACYYIGITTKDIPTLKLRLNHILPYINNWAICDTFVSSLKILKKHGAEMFATMLEYLNNKNDFIVRFGIVCLLSYYISNDSIDFLLNRLTLIKNDSYYIEMAIAWFISVAFVKCRQETLKCLENRMFSKTIHNKSISKICDSFRVCENDKTLVKTLKID